MVAINQFIFFFIGFVGSLSLGNIYLIITCILFVIMNLKKIDISIGEYYILIAIFFFGSILNLTTHGATEDLSKDSVLIVCTFLSLLFFNSLSDNYNSNRLNRVLDLALAGSIIFYLVNISFFNRSPIEITESIFPNSSYHLISTIFLFFIAFSYILEGKITYRSLILFVLLNLLIGGRTGIATSIALLFARFLFPSVGIKFDANLYTRLIIFMILFFALQQSLFDFVLNIGDFSYKGLSSVQRDLIGTCYLGLLTARDYFYGFEPADFYFCYEIYFNKPKTESSFLSAISNLGFFGFFAMLFILIKLIRIIFKNILLGIMLILIIFRFSTGDFLFFTPYDILFFPLLLMMDKRQLPKYEK